MTRECQVRICERLGVKLPGPTRRETVSNLGVVWFELPASVSPTIAAEHPAVPWPALASRAWTAPPRPVGPPRPATSASFPWSAVTRLIVPPRFETVSFRMTG
jgi:hypothetical protein